MFLPQAPDSHVFRTVVRISIFRSLSIAVSVPLQSFVRSAELKFLRPMLLIEPYNTLLCERSTLWRCTRVIFSRTLRYMERSFVEGWPTTSGPTIQSGMLLFPVVSFHPWWYVPEKSGGEGSHDRKSVQLQWSDKTFLWGRRHRCEEGLASARRSPRLERRDRSRSVNSGGEVHPQLVLFFSPTGVRGQTLSVDIL